MSQNTGCGVFGLSVDISSTATNGEIGKSSKASLSNLLGVLRRVQVPATFATATPGNDSFVAHLRNESLAHEVAVLADKSWVGPDIGRTKFARELAARIDSAKRSGIAVHTLAITDSELTANLDLLVKHRISVVRSTANRGFEPQSLRFGIWQAPVSFMLPATGWKFGGTEWAINRALTRATRQNGLVHLVVDLDTLSDQSEAATLERVLTTVSRRCSKGHVVALTMRGVVARLAPKRQAVTAKSVLRVA